MPEVIISASGPQYGLVVNSDGSINISGTVAVGGNIVIGSVSATVDSIYVQSGNNIHLGSAWTNIGSVVISNFDQIGSLGIQNTIGSVYQLTNPWIVTGSINIDNFSQVGSIGVQTVTGSITVQSESVGYDTYQFILGSAGSGTASNFVFVAQSESLAIDNLGSTNVYVNFNGTAVVGSPSFIIPGYESRAFDARVGSVSVLGSGGQTPNIQIMRLS